MPRHKRKTGMPPGTPVFTGDKFPVKTFTTCIKYNDASYEEIDDFNLIHLDAEGDFKFWIDIRGVNDSKYIEAVGQKFQIHSLALEDILEIEQRPKMDEYQNAIFITAIALKMNPLSGELIKEQITLYFGKNFLISFQEDADDFLKVIRDRIHQKRGRVRQRNTDYLAYSILDYTVDHYYDALDFIEKKLSDMDELLHEENSIINQKELHDIKIQVIRIRKSIYPMREVINRFIRTENPLIFPETDVYLRDLADHSIQIAEMSETYQDMANSLHDLYQAETSNRLNNVMKILTIISTIFIPLTFIAGIYGMNFHYMPELTWRLGYFMILGVMAIVAILFLLYFRRKKWL